MVVDMIFKTAGGLGLFLFGMGLMSDGLKKAAGEKLRSLLETMTNNPLMGFTVGMVVTSIIQSSSATTVMLIGLINAGIMTFHQAICVIFGTNIGTTVTAWIVSASGLKLGTLDISLYSLPVIGIGFLMDVVGKSRKVKSTGLILLGFGVLFVGIGFMGEAFAGLKDNATVVNWMAGLGGKPIFSMLAGLGVTLLIQSSSASIAIVQQLAFHGAFGSDWHNVLNIAVPFVLGANIGTTITAQLASIRTNISARRAAWAHTMFNVSGTLITLPFVYTGWYAKLVHFIAPWQLDVSTIQPSIAVAHTMFNVVFAILFLPFYRQFEKFIVAMVPAKGSELARRPVVLEKRLLDTPVLALQQAKREIIRMTQNAKEAVHNATEGILKNDTKRLDKTRRLEDSIDDFQHQITTYLVLLSQRQLNEEVSVELPVLLHMVNDLERVGDHAVNIAEIAERKIDNKMVFSETAIQESTAIIDEAERMFDEIIKALEKNDVVMARKALYSEGKINRMQVNCRRNHVIRMTEGKCSAEAGLIFIDLVDNVEKIGDHLTNIAQSVIGGLQWANIKENTLSGEWQAQVTNNDDH